MLVISACSSNPVAGNKEDSFDESAITDAPKIQKEEKRHEVAEEPPPARVQGPTTPSQYNALNDAIKAQSDERIYQAAVQILTHASNDPKALNALAMYHYKKNRFELARHLLNKAISAEPKTAELYSNLGVVQLTQGEKRDAIKSFRRALDINSDEAVAAANLGAIYVLEKDYGKAQMVLETAYRRGVRDSRVLTNYAVALTANRKYDKAQDLYKAALKESSNNKEALFNYAILLVEHLGKNDEAMEVINRLKFVGGPADSRNRINALENKAKAGLK